MSYYKYSIANKGLLFCFFFLESKSSVKMRERAEELRVKSAAAWIDNWKAKTKLEGTLKVGKKK